ncbi:DsbA family protein [Puniceibacterium sp. IMCC21224]|uniref:DsbA family protein n=1 Tax=Puniceibacterium sp. IMCC21224 TaxID=1618204 RepID=UPI00064D9703|nr:DsbA family protein [Puniceibacterium sp. IMCC21224]KMK65587.1 protein-disulfide isomerase [Puniceibacterium sp. IMCC21224]
MKRIIPVAALALTLIAGGGWLLSQPRTTASGGFDLPGAASAQESTAADVEITDMVQGDVNAPVEVVEYASFTCPHCANFHATVYDQLKENYIDTGKIKFVYREVYFDKYGVWASMIARCGGPEKFFGITGLMYKGQSEWVRAGADGAIADELRKIGLLAGITKDQLDTCLADSDQLRGLVAWYQENATRDDVTSTPTFLIDGKKYSNMNYADFSAVLDEKLGE